MQVSMQGKDVLRRFQRGMPAILLGTLFNVLDAVSTGLLVFPSDGGAFAGLQFKSMSTYIMSTIICQLVMTAGGSLFPGGIGAMLIEVLPFMRAVAMDIRDALGNDSPSVVPTVMVAYSLASFLIGIVFLVLGAIGAGSLMSYFPQTVLTGVIGSIGVSLFVLGLELPLKSHHALSFSNAGAVLFSRQHIPLLLASLLPIIFMCFSVRSRFLSRVTCGAVEHPYYVPLYFLAMGALFWIVVAAIGIETHGGLGGLVEDGWLFSPGVSPGESKVSFTDALNYWSLFDFKLVRMSALSHAVTNFVLLVVIGVLNLPVYVPALALTLDTPYSMNHELIGQGAANILAGAVGSVPNILQLSYSVFFTRAGGQRFEAAVVIALAVVLFFVSSYLLPYVPTIMGSGLVLFLGIELTLEAVWESTKDLMWTEWLVVMGTLLACTFAGFAPGVGIGLGTAIVVYAGWGCWDLRAKATYINRNLILLDQNSKRISRRLGRQGLSHSMSGGYERLAKTNFQESTTEIPSEKPQPQIRKIDLNGYVFFGVIPSIAAQLTAQVTPESLKEGFERGNTGTVRQQYAILDMQAVNRIETAAARVIRTKAQDTPGLTIVLCGLEESSGTAADLIRSGLNLVFYSNRRAQANDTNEKGVVRVFSNCSEAVMWCEADANQRELESQKVSDFPAQRFLGLFSPKSTLAEDNPATADTCDLESTEELQVHIRPPGSRVASIHALTDTNIARFVFVVSGTLELPSYALQPSTVSAGVRYHRDSLRVAVVGAFRTGLNGIRNWLKSVTGPVTQGQLGAITSSSSLDATESESDIKESRLAGPGSTICLLGEKEMPVDATSSCTALLWSGELNVHHTYPIAHGSGVTLLGGHDDEYEHEYSSPPWLIEVPIPRSLSSFSLPLSEQTVEQLHQKALLRAIDEAKKLL